MVSEAKTESEIDFVIIRDEFEDEEEPEMEAEKSSRSVPSLKSRKSVASTVDTQETDGSESVSLRTYQNLFLFTIVFSSNLCSFKSVSIAII